MAWSYFCCTSTKYWLHRYRAHPRRREPSNFEARRAADFGEHKLADLVRNLTGRAQREWRIGCSRASTKNCAPSANEAPAVPMSGRFCAEIGDALPRFRGRGGGVSLATTSRDETPGCSFLEISLE